MLLFSIINVRTIPSIWVTRGVARNGVEWQYVVRAICPVGAFLIEGWPALIGAVLVQEGGLWLTRRIARACHRRLCTNLFVLAYVLRTAILLPTHYVAKSGDGSGALFRDDYTNDLVAQWLVRIAHGEGATAIFPGHQYLLDSVYTYLLMAIYAIFGYAPILPKLLNISLGALCAVFTFEISRKLFSQRAAILAALGSALLPSLIVWSVATLKETLVLLTCLVALWLLQILCEAKRGDRSFVNAAVGLFGVGILLLDLRDASAFIVVGLVAVVTIGRLHLRLRPWQMALAGGMIAALVVGGLLVMRARTNDRPWSASLEDVALQIRHRRAQEAAGASSQLRVADLVASDTVPDRPGAEVNSDTTPFSFVADVIDPLGYALLAPTPMQAQSALELAASGEMLVWDILLVASIFAWWAGPRNRLFFVCLVAYGVANWLVLAAVEGNVGNLLRHRLMLDPVLLVLGMAGLECLWLTGRGSAAARRASLQRRAQTPAISGLKQEQAN